MAQGAGVRRGLAADVAVRCPSTDPHLTGHLEAASPAAARRRPRLRPSPPRHVPAGRPRRRRRRRPGGPRVNADGAERRGDVARRPATAAPAAQPAPVPRAVGPAPTAAGRCAAPAAPRRTTPPRSTSAPDRGRLRRRPGPGTDVGLGYDRGPDHGRGADLPDGARMAPARPRRRASVPDDRTAGDGPAAWARSSASAEHRPQDVGESRSSRWRRTELKEEAAKAGKGRRDARRGRRRRHCWR